MRGLILLLTLLAGAVHAHPEHPSGLMSLAHMLSEPDHLAMLLIPLAVAAGILVCRSKIAARRRVQ